MNYLRPNLWPFTYASIPDFSASSNYGVGGTTAQALQLITQIRDLTAAVSWDVDYPGPPGPGTSSIYSRSVLCSNPGAAPATSFQTHFGYYYSDFVGTRWPDPASRVLATLATAASGWPYADTSYADSQSMTILLRATKTGAGLVQTALEWNSTDAGQATSAAMNSSPATLLATIPITLVTPYFSINFGDMMLGVNATPPIIPTPVVNSFSASLTATFW